METKRLKEQAMELGMHPALSLSQQAKLISQIGWALIAAYEKGKRVRLLEELTTLREEVDEIKAHLVL